jgi:hypothetical protein
MAWNADVTRMPYRMHSEYLRRLYLNNDLAEGRYQVGGGRWRSPTSKCRCSSSARCATTSPLAHPSTRCTCSVMRRLTFVLTSGGHNAGVVSEPGHPRRSYRLRTRRPAATTSRPKTGSSRRPSTRARGGRPGATGSRLLDAPDWQQVGFVAADLGWKSLQQRNCALLKMAEAVVANQSALQQDMQQAWAQWQHDCTRALKEASGAMPLSTTLENLLATATRPPMLPDGKG